jgi:hypothetical protein
MQTRLLRRPGGRGRSGRRDDRDDRDGQQNERETRFQTEVSSAIIASSRSRSGTSGASLIIRT